MQQMIFGVPAAVPLFFANEVDKTAGVVGLTPTVHLAPPGQAFYASIGTVTERGFGWYDFLPTVLDTIPPGRWKLHAVGLGADPVDLTYESVSYLPSEVPAVLAATHGVGSWESGIVNTGPIVGSAYSVTARQTTEARVMRGDDPVVPFAVGADWTEWTCHFGARTHPEAAAYAMAEREILWDAATGSGSISLSTTDTAIAGRYVAELEARNGSRRLTLLRFDLVVMQDVVRP